MKVLFAENIADASMAQNVFIRYFSKSGVNREKLFVFYALIVKKVVSLKKNMPSVV